MVPEVSIELLDFLDYMAKEGLAKEIHDWNEFYEMGETAFPVFFIKNSNKVYGSLYWDFCNRKLYVIRGIEADLMADMIQS